MGKKSTFWLLSFSFLILLNLYATARYVNKVRKVNAANQILEEIEEGGSLQDQFATQTGPAKQQGLKTIVQTQDARAANLKIFFRRHNSPLYDYADHIVKVSDKYQFDYRLLPAIAMQESTLCRNIPADSHNCWGWGITADSVTRFASYEEAIETVAKGLRKNYLDKGLTTASKIMEKYTPSSNGSWAAAVNGFMRALE
ncbi:hypothetical protein HYT33_00675 [Candidatus Roizmanbacteria bacterium]|nr:hypothetical protein [Candidatus Roizmanbacteria bacterium]